MSYFTPFDVNSATEWVEREIQQARSYDNGQARRGHEPEWTDFVEQIGPGVLAMLHAIGRRTPRSALTAFNATVANLINEHVGNEEQYMSYDDIHHELENVIASSRPEMANYLTELQLFWQDHLDAHETRDFVLQYVERLRTEHAYRVRHPMAAEEMRDRHTTWHQQHLAADPLPPQHRLASLRVPMSDDEHYRNAAYDHDDEHQYPHRGSPGFISSDDEAGASKPRRKSSKPRRKSSKPRRKSSKPRRKSNKPRRKSKKSGK
jgi:hypothetical protein